MGISLRCGLRRGVAAAGALALALAGGLLGAVPNAAAASPTPTFSRAVVVDQQRPGFEPDGKVDSKGTIYTSVPFGFSTTQSFVWSSRDHGNSYQLTPGNIGPGKPATCAGGGTILYSVTAFSATSAAPQSATTVFNLIDATTPFDHTGGDRYGR